MVFLPFFTTIKTLLEDVANKEIIKMIHFDHQSPLTSETLKRSVAAMLWQQLCYGISAQMFPRCHWPTSSSL